MALTAEQINQIRAKHGYSPLSSGGGTVQSQLTPEQIDQIRSKYGYQPLQQKEQPFFNTKDFGRRFLQNLVGAPGKLLKMAPTVAEESAAFVPRSIANLGVRFGSELSTQFGGKPLTYPTKEQAPLAAKIPILRKAIPFGETPRLPKQILAPKEQREAFARQLATSEGRQPGMAEKIASILITSPLTEPLTEAAAIPLLATDPLGGLLSGIKPFKPTIKPQAITKGPTLARRIAENQINKTMGLGVPQIRKIRNTTGVESPAGWLIDRNMPRTANQAEESLVNYWHGTKKIVDDRLALMPEKLKPKNPAIKSILEDQVKYWTEAEVGTGNTRFLDLAKNRLARLKSEGLTIAEINDVKRIYERSEKLAYKYDRSATVAPKKARATELDSMVRKYIEKEAAKKGFTNIDKFNKETQVAYEIAASIGKVGPKGMPLIDQMLVAGGTLNPKAWAVLMGKRILFGERGRSILSQILAPGTKKGIPTPSISKGKLKTILQRSQEVKPRIQPTKSANIQSILEK